MRSRQLSLVLAVAGAGVMALAGARRRRTIDLAGKSVVIFGGSRGLGLLMAEEFASRGAHLTLVARDADELARARTHVGLRTAPVDVLVCDIRDRQQVEDTIARIVADGRTIDVLVNDAGIIQVGPFTHMAVEDFENAMATHFWGPLFTILAALPYMPRNGQSRIVNVSSIGGKIAVPHLLPYTASKFALTGLSEGLCAELARDGIRVTTVCPGLMRTGSTYNAWFKGQHRREFAWFHLASSIPGLTMHARRAAAQIVNACRRGDPELVITMPARLAVLMNAMSPSLMALAMSVTNRLLPSPTTGAGNQSYAGWQSVSSAVPSAITKLTDRASVANNEWPRAASADHRP